MLTDQTIYQVLKRQAEQNPDAVAILACGRAPLSYGALCRHTEQTVAQLNRAGMTRQDRIALVLPNGPEMAAAFLGTACAAVSAPLNPAYTAGEFEFYLRDLGAKAVIVQADFDSPARDVARQLGTRIFDLRPQQQAPAGIFHLDISGGRCDAGRQSVQPRDVALVLHTSGTTARPKIVPLTHANLWASARNTAASLALTGQDRCLNVMPLFHIHGLMAAVLSSLSAGSSVVCTGGFETTRFLNWLSAFQPTWYTAVPTMHQAILAQAKADPGKAMGSSLRLIRSCSAALAPQVLAGLEQAFGVPVIESYGMTEASHQMTSNPLPPRPRKPGTVGLAAACDVAIMDEAGQLLAPGQSGQIVIRGPNVSSGYENNPAANLSSFIDGWFRTGDRGVLDGDGYLTIIGRIKEMINRGGEKIAPREVDEVLLAHPSVQDAVAFAVPHRSLGEDLAAAVVLRSGMATTPRELRQYALSRLAGHKVPSRIVIVERIPKGPTGKVQRIGLAAKLASQMDSEYAAPRSPLEESLARSWARVLGLEKVGIHDNFFTLGGDSLAGVQVALDVERLAGRPLDRSILFEAPTIAELADWLEQGVLGGTGSDLLPMQPKGSKTPFFCIPGHGGDVFTFSDMACHLGPDRPVYVFRLPEPAARNNEVANAMIEQIAERFIEQLQNVQPQGPYLLGGFCYGGEVAFRMAGRLRAMGQTVGVVAIMELYVDGAVRKPLKGFRHHVEQLKQRKGRQKVIYALGRARGALIRIGDRCLPVVGQRLRRVLRQNHRLEYYPGRITLFRCQEFDNELYRDDRLMGWQGLARWIDVYGIPGNRLTAFKEPHVRVLAHKLRQCLDEATENSAPPGTRHRQEALPGGAPLS